MLQLFLGARAVHAGAELLRLNIPRICRNKREPQCKTCVSAPNSEARGVGVLTLDVVCAVIDIGNLLGVFSLEDGLELFLVEGRVGGRG